MEPRAEIAHWWFGSAFLLLGLILLAEVVVGPAVFAMRPWRRYLWPATALASGTFLWLVAALSTFSTLHLIAHSIWAQTAMIAGAVELALVRGVLRRPAWALVTAGMLSVSGASFLVHEQNGWLFARSAFLHHMVGWVLIVSSLIPLGRAIQPRRAQVWSTGFAVTVILVAVLLLCDRDVAPIFGHLSDFAGGPR
jgi:hypothetical protein